jgi:hypothetical protein
MQILDDCDQRPETTLGQENEQELTPPISFPLDLLRIGAVIG